MIRATLDNGLRVVVVPDHTTRVVAVAVHYQAGFRADPETRPGLAHVLEHLMFSGSASTADHFRAVEAMGGFCNASTRQDYTDFCTVVPTWAVAAVLEVEAARMSAPRLGAAALRTQIDVVRDEIDRKMSGRPYGGFPWPLIAPVLYRRYPDAHNGYGDAAALAQATLAEVTAFFETHYTPANAVLTIAGDVDANEVLELVHRHFDGIQGRPRCAAGTDEPELAVENHGSHADPLAALPAVAAAYRIPAASHDIRAYLSLTTLASILTRGSESRLSTALSDLALSVSARVGFFDLLDVRDTDVWILTATHNGTGGGRARVLDLLDAELAELAANEPTPDELARARARQVTGYYRGIDQPAVRVRALGRAELLFDDAKLALDLPDRLGRVTAADIAAAADWLTTRPRAVLAIAPEGQLQ